MKAIKSFLSCYSGQPSTGVELRKKMNDDFQDFIDFVDPIIKNPLASNEGRFCPLWYISDDFYYRIHSLWLIVYDIKRYHLRILNIIPVFSNSFGRRIRASDWNAQEAQEQQPSRSEIILRFETRCSSRL